MDLYLFRHGATVESRGGNLTYAKDRVIIAPILTTSIPVIKKLGQYLKNIETDANFSSPYIRCRQTSSLVSQITGRNFIYDKRLGEYFDETFNELAERVRDFYSFLAAKKYDSVAICTHGAVLAGLKHIALTNRFKEQNLTDFPNPGTLWIIKKGKIEAVNLSTDHRE